MPDKLIKTGGQVFLRGIELFLAIEKQNTLPISAREINGNKQ